MRFVFDEVNGSVPSGSRTTIMMLTLRTHGTDEQCQKSIARLKSEIELQGFDVDFDDIHTVET